MKMIGKLFLSALFIAVIFSVNAQDPNRYNTQVEELVNREHHFDPAKQLVVFTGSSSIRMWKDVQDYFPGYNVINNGFGGSHFSDLLHFYNELILRPEPDILFIYEGDNDIANNKEPSAVFREAKELAKMIRKDLPETQIIFISAKPSIRRESFEQQYKQLNRKIKRYACCRKNIAFADVWSAMMADDGKVMRDLFLNDNLHMNKKGYDIWGEVIREFLPREQRIPIR